MQGIKSVKVKEYHVTVGIANGFGLSYRLTPSRRLWTWTVKLGKLFFVVTKPKPGDAK